MSDVIAINLRSIQHYMYCPRRYALLELNRDWNENAFVVQANLLHEHVHDGSHSFSDSRKVVRSDVTVYRDYPEYDLNGVLDCAEEMMMSRDSSRAEKDIPADAELVFERSGWEHVSEWIDQVPNLGNGKQKYFVFRLRKDSPAADAGFPTILLGVMAARYDAMDGGMNCIISRSSDGINHFRLLQK